MQAVLFLELLKHGVVHKRLLQTHYAIPPQEFLAPRGGKCVATIAPGVLAQIRVSINIDAHADLRQDAGRHSGNAFSAARREKFLERYCVVGLQEPFVNDAMFEQFQKEDGLHAMTLERIRTRLFSGSEMLGYFPFGKMWPHAPHIAVMEEAAKFAKKRPLALEMDLDAITGVAASAPTTAGLAVEEVREMLRYIGARRNVSTFHICEGIADETDSQGVGALTALLMSDVIKTVLARRAK